MTCIVALKHNGDVYMGADSAGVADYRILTRKDPKIYRVGDMLIGFTSSFRMGQLLGYSLVAPLRDPNKSLDEWMATAFINAVRDCLKAGGFTTVENNTEGGGVFLVAVEGRIFEIDSDFQVGESCDDYQAVGCGIDLALGSLYSSSQKKITDPKAAIKTALEAAAKFSAGVRAPWLIEKL